MTTKKIQNIARSQKEAGRGVVKRREREDEDEKREEDGKDAYIPDNDTDASNSGRTPAARRPCPVVHQVSRISWNR